MTERSASISNSPQLFGLRNFAIFLGVLLAVWFWPVVFGNHTFVYRDFGYFGFPLAAHHRAAFWNGEIPLWNPLSHCGIPFLAQWNTMTLYPGSLLYLLLPVEAALGWFSLLHLWLAGIGMYQLAHAWYRNEFTATIAGLGFAISGLGLNFLLWPNNVAALGWMPFVVWLGLEKRFLPAVTAGTMQMLAGAPEVVLLTWAILGALTVERCWEEKSVAPGKMVLGMALVVSLVCAAQLLPFLDLARISQRDRDFGGAFWAMPPWGWMSFFVPLVYTYPLSNNVQFQFDQLWTSSYYSSIVVTFLAGVALLGWKQRSRREKVLFGIALVALLLALGPAGKVYSLFRAVVPGLGLIRFPVKFVIVVAFALPLLAACGAATIDQRARKNVWRGMTLLILLILIYAKTHPKYGPEFNNLKVAIYSGGLAFLVATLTAIFLGRLQTRPFQIALLLLVPLDIFFHAPNPAPAIPREAFKRSEGEIPPGRAMLSRHTFQELYDRTASPDARQNFLSNRAVLNANLNLIDGAPKVDGFFSLNTAWGERLRNQLYAKGQGNLDAGMDLMGVTRVTSTNNIFEWRSRASAMPLITAGQSPRFLDETNCLNALFDLRFIPREKVVFFERFEGYDTNRVAAEVREVKRGDHAISFEVEAARPTFAVIAEAFHPNWRVTVNGQPGRVLRANYAFQAVAIPQGRSKVELKYVDRAFQWGMGISLATLAGIFVLAFRK